MSASEMFWIVFIVAILFGARAAAAVALLLLWLANASPVR